MDPWPNPLLRQERPDSQRIELQSPNTRLLIDFPAIPEESKPAPNTSLLSAHYGPNTYTLTVYSDPAPLLEETEMPLQEHLIVQENLQAEQIEEGKYQNSTLNYQLISTEEQSDFTELFFEAGLQPEVRFILPPPYTKARLRFRIYLSDEVIYVLGIKQELDPRPNPDPTAPPQTPPPLEQDPFIDQSIFFP